MKEILEDAAGLIERAVMEGSFTRGERAYLGSTASRLRSMVGAMVDEAEAEEPEPEEPLRRPERTWSRKEAAQLIRCHPNTLLNWESRGLLPIRRDWRGWRVYTRDDLARAMAIDAHLPPEEIARAGERRRRPRGSTT